MQEVPDILKQIADGRQQTSDGMCCFATEYMVYAIKIDAVWCRRFAEKKNGRNKTLPLCTLFYLFYAINIDKTSAIRYLQSDI